MTAKIANLVKAARLGNNSPLIAEFLPHIKNIVKKRVPTDDVDDVTHNIIDTVLKDLPKLNEDEVFHPWAYSIALRKIALYFRKRYSRAETVQLNNQNIIDPKSTAEGPLVDEETRECIRQALQGLTDYHREVITRYYWENMKIDQIAADMKQPPGNIKRWLHEAKKSLRRSLSDLI